MRKFLIVYSAGQITGNCYVTTQSNLPSQIDIEAIQESVAIDLGFTTSKGHVVVIGIYELSAN